MNISTSPSTPPSLLPPLLLQIKPMSNTKNKPIIPPLRLPQSISSPSPLRQPHQNSPALPKSKREIDYSVMGSGGDEKEGYEDDDYDDDDDDDDDFSTITTTPPSSRRSTTHTPQPHLIYPDGTPLEPTTNAIIYDQDTDTDADKDKDNDNVNIIPVISQKNESLNIVRYLTSSKITLNKPINLNFDSIRPSKTTKKNINRTFQSTILTLTHSKKSSITCIAFIVLSVLSELYVLAPKYNVGLAFYSFWMMRVLRIDRVSSTNSSISSSSKTTMSILPLKPKVYIKFYTSVMVLSIFVDLTHLITSIRPSNLSTGLTGNPFGAGDSEYHHENVMVFSFICLSIICCIKVWLIMLVKINQSSTRNTSRNRRGDVHNNNKPLIGTIYRSVKYYIPTTNKPIPVTMDDNNNKIKLALKHIKLTIVKRMYALTFLTLFTLLSLLLITLTMFNSNHHGLTYKKYVLSLQTVCVLKCVALFLSFCRMLGKINHMRFFKSLGLISLFKSLSCCRKDKDAVKDKDKDRIRYKATYKATLKLTASCLSKTIYLKAIDCILGIWVLTNLLWAIQNSSSSSAYIPTSLNVTYFCLFVVLFVNDLVGMLDLVCVYRCYMRYVDVKYLIYREFGGVFSDDFDGGGDGGGEGDSDSDSSDSGDSDDSDTEYDDNNAKVNTSASVSSSGNNSGNGYMDANGYWHEGNTPVRVKARYRDAPPPHLHIEHEHENKHSDRSINTTSSPLNQTFDSNISIRHDEFTNLWSHPSIESNKITFTVLTSHTPLLKELISHLMNRRFFVVAEGVGSDGVGVVYAVAGCGGVRCLVCLTVGFEMQRLGCDFRVEQRYEEEGGSVMAFVRGLELGGIFGEFVEVQEE